MDVRERIAHPLEGIDAALDARQAQMWTAVPVIIESFDATKGTVVAQPAIKATRRTHDGKVERIDLPLIQDAPVHFPSGGGSTMTFPITKGDEGLALVSNRSIDQWWQSGGVQQQTSSRMHDLSDSMILVGFRSQPRKLSNVSTTSTQLRNDDGTIALDMHPTDGWTMTKGDGKAELKNTYSRVTKGGLFVNVTQTFVDLGGLGGSFVMTESGPSTKVRAILA